MIFGRVEPATPGSAVRLALDARDSAARYAWAAAWQSQQNGHCAQRRHRSACTSAQSDQSSLSAWTNIGSSATYWVHYEDWSDRADAQADLSLRGAQRPFCWFCHKVAHIQKVHPIFASGLRNKPHFLSPCSLALWMQSQGSLIRAQALPHTGYTCNLHRISHKIMYMVFLLFPLIQERQFLVISESIRTLDHFVLVNSLEGLSLSARRNGLSRSFNCISGIHRPRISQSDLLVHARDSRNRKLILA